MRNRLVAIFVCLLLSYVVNYALGEWLSDGIVNWSPPVAEMDGSSLNASRILQERPDTALSLGAAEEALLDYYTWLDAGGTSNYQNWRTAITELPEVTSPFLARALEVADSTNTSRFLALLLLIVTALMLWGKAFKESALLTPLLYFGVTLGTIGLYGSLSSPLFTAVLGGSYLVYFVALRLFLPIFHTEWSRMMRPFLTLQLFLLATMAFRGPEMVEYWIWTSPLYRLGLTLFTLLTVFFHLSIVSVVLKKAEMERIAQFFAFGMPLGFTLGLLGLVLGFYGSEAGAGLGQINAELTTLPLATVASINPESPFLLTGAGIILAIFSGIGYFVQRIAR